MRSGVLIGAGHVNNLYNTTFWASSRLRNGKCRGGEMLKGTVAAEKNEMLWARFGINYNEVSEMFRKGSVVFRDVSTELSSRRGGGLMISMKSRDKME